ncbi:MAG: carboxypeptidase regulatory-like domain-containing protein [Planctomycetes bacterium]|nr:carboxypeptidase regulatory-like domain-containing protein [Planctomycetota bacterium]
MRTSTLMAGLFALLIVAGVSFGAGYYLGHESEGASADTRPVVALDTQPVDPPLKEGAGPLASPDNTKSDAPTLTQTPSPEVAPKPATEGPGEGAVTKPDDSRVSASDADITPADVKDAVNDLKTRLGKIKEGELPGADDFDSIFNGPQVDFTATIGGQVVDATGVPVAGASVHANFSQNYAADDGGRSVRLVVAAGENKGEPIATTDGGGYWTAAINRKVAEKATLNVSLVGGAPGYADSEKNNVTLKNGDNRENIRLTLRGAGTVSGRVVDANGLGVAGVTVSLRAGGSNLFGGDDIEIDFGGAGAGKNAASTDGGGEFLIEGVPEGRYKFKLSGTGYRQISGPTEIDVKSGQSHRAPADFQVAVTGSVTATFVDIEGNPVTGWATLTVKDENGKTVKRLNGSLGTGGVFEKNDPPAGSYEVEIRVYGYKTLTRPATFTEGQRYDFGVITLETDDSESGKGIYLPSDE